MREGKRKGPGGGGGGGEEEHEAPMPLIEHSLPLSFTRRNRECYVSMSQV